MFPSESTIYALPLQGVGRFEKQFFKAIAGL